MKTTASSIIAIITAIAAPSLAAPSLVQNSTLSVSNVTNSTGNSSAFQPDSALAASSFSASASQPSSTPTSSFRPGATPSAAYTPLPASAGANLTQHPNAGKLSTSAMLRHEAHELLDMADALDSEKSNHTMIQNGTLSVRPSSDNSTGLDKRQWGGSDSVSGQGTYYWQNGQPGACGEYHGDYDTIVAIAQWFWDDNGGSSLCGRNVIIWSPYAGTGVVTAQLVDNCPGCNGYDIDLSYGVFGTLSNYNYDEGEISVAYYIE